MSLEALNAACRESFNAFAAKSFSIIEPGTAYEWSWHIGCISEHLEAVYNGEIRRLIINEPPRTLKSFLVARSFPAWVMGKRPSEKFISTSYGYEVTEQNAMACRRIIKSDWYHNCFPNTLITPELDRNTHFETTQGGQYYAASAMSPITGIGCNTLLIDDPVKPMEAYSETIRTSTNQNIRTTLFSRLNDKRTGSIVLIMQRLHEDDPTGHLLKDGGWTHVKLPAEAKTHVLIRLKDKEWEMQPGDLLFSKRLSREILDQDLLDMSAANYAGQMLQEPVPVGGGEFKPEEWIQYYRNGSLKPKTMNVVILADPAGGDEINKKKKKLSDWTTFLVFGLAPDNNYYWLDGIRDRLNPTERVNTLFMLHRKWNELCGKPPKVGYEKYGMMTDTHYLKGKMSEDSYHFSLVELGGAMNKEERIRKLIPDMQNHRWYFPDTMPYVDGEGRYFDLIKEMINEMQSFPRSRWDDLMDNASRIYEDDLHMVFPKPKKTMTQKAMDGRTQQDEGWINW